MAQAFCSPPLNAEDRVQSHDRHFGFWGGKIGMFHSHMKSRPAPTLSMIDVSLSLSPSLCIHTHTHTYTYIISCGVSDRSLIMASFSHSDTPQWVRVHMSGQPDTETST
jgi:hypothetical protein